MKTLVVRHQVRDFKTWKKYFDDDEKPRRAAGLKLRHVYQSLEDPNDIMFDCKVEDLDKLKAFLASPERNEIKAKYGVIGDPEIFIGNTV
jgi:hypothetical protein